jgi:hypothetical protein
MHTLPMYPITHLGITNLVAKDEQIDQGDHSAAVSVDLPGDRPISGELLSFMFHAAETGSGALLPSAGELLVFTADPEHSSGDVGTGITAAEWQTCIGRVKVAATDWTEESLACFAYIPDQPVPFYDAETLYFVWRHTDATSINSAAGDDETLDFDATYLRYS